MSICRIERSRPLRSSGLVCSPGRISLRTWRRSGSPLPYTTVRSSMCTGRALTLSLIARKRPSERPTSMVSRSTRKPTSRHPRGTQVSPARRSLSDCCAAACPAGPNTGDRGHRGDEDAGAAGSRRVAGQARRHSRTMARFQSRTAFRAIARTWAPLPIQLSPGTRRLSSPCEGPGAQPPEC